MVAKKELLEIKLDTVNKQIKDNIIIGITCILVLVFNPIFKLEDVIFNFNIAAIIAFFALLFTLFWGFSLRSKKEDILAELSIFNINESKKETKIIEKQVKAEFICRFCGTHFKSEETLENHSVVCETKRERVKKDKNLAIWAVGVIIFIGLGLYFSMNKKIDLIPLVLIGFIITPFFDKLFIWYAKKTNISKHFQFSWWKKIIVILGIAFIFVLINRLIP